MRAIPLPKWWHQEQCCSVVPVGQQDSFAFETAPLYLLDFYPEEEHGTLFMDTDTEKSTFLGQRETASGAKAFCALLALRRPSSWWPPVS